MRRADQPDTPADVALRACIAASQRQSFVMMAGAGSGKTTSLIKALAAVIQLHGPSLKKHRRRVACITYTDIAAGEIWDDVGNNVPLTHPERLAALLTADRCQLSAESQLARVNEDDPVHHHGP